MSKTIKVFIAVVLSTVVAFFIALPPQYSFNKQLEFKKGLDIQGGMQIVLQAQVDSLAEEDRLDALNSAREVILRRVDLYGVSEPSVQTSLANNNYRLIVELPGIEDPQAALELVGRTALLEFQLLKMQAPEDLGTAAAPDSLDASSSATASQSAFVSFQATGITGKQLKKATAQVDQNTFEPVVGLSFNDEGRDLFAKVTEENIGERLGIIIDGSMLIAPVINSPIYDGQAIISGGFTSEEARQLTVQLNAGALPVAIEVLEQRSIGASLGASEVEQSIKAGLVGIGLVMLFMILYYKAQGVIASLALVIYAIYTVAIYKLLGITLTLPGIAGLLLSVGMAVDANILIFERMKEELRLGKPFSLAMERGFGRAWDSIKDANITTIFTALILINPLELPFLNTAGMVRGFGVTLLIGVVLSLFTGIVVSRTLMRLFLKEKS